MSDTFLMMRPPHLAFRGFTLEWVVVLVMVGRVWVVVEWWLRWWWFGHIGRIRVVVEEVTTAVWTRQTRS